jgi:hypothetical protein
VERRLPSLDTAKRIIDYEMFHAVPPLYALEKYDPTISPQADFEFQQTRLARICLPANSLGEKLLINAAEYGESLALSSITNNEVSAMRWRAAQTMTDALSRFAGIYDAIDIMLERNPEEEHNLLESVMSLHVRPGASGRLELDTGLISYEQFVEHTRQGWYDVCSSLVDRF